MTGRKRWLVAILQYGLCLVAVAYLVHRVPWYSQVRLRDGVQVRFLEQRGDQLEIERDGSRDTVSVREADHAVIDGRPVLKIESGIRDVVLRLKWGWALYALLAFAPVGLLQAYRLTLMVAVQGVRLSFWNALKLTFAGNFFNFALPGTTGGDVIKAYYLSRYTHLKTEVVTTVFLDRAIGLVGLVIVAAAALGLTRAQELSAELVTVLGGIAACLSAGAAVVFSRRLRHRLRLPALAARLPGGRQLLRIGRATVAMRSSKGRVGVALLLTLVVQGACTVSAAIMAWALEMQGPGGPFAQIWYFVSYVSIGFLIAAVPLTPQSIGVMETVYVQFFTRGGWNTASQAVAFALAVRMIQLAWAVPGVLVPLSGAHLPRKDELEALSEEKAAEVRVG